MRHNEGAIFPAMPCSVCGVPMRRVMSKVASPYSPHKTAYTYRCEICLSVCADCGGFVGACPCKNNLMAQGATCPNCGETRRLVNLISSRSTEYRRVWRWDCLHCNSQCPDCGEMNVNCTCDNQLSLFGAASGLPRRARDGSL